MNHVLAFSVLGLLEEKDTLGVGQAQLWNQTAIPKQPVWVVATYSGLPLASLQAFAPRRDTHYLSLLKWCNKSKRPSCLDLITLLHQEVLHHPETLSKYNLQYSGLQLLCPAAA